MFQKKLSPAAIEVIRLKETHRAIEDFFDVKPRAVDNWIAENRPDGPLCNINLRDIIARYAILLTDTSLTEADIYVQA